MYTLLEHCDLLAYVIVSNLCRKTWFWQTHQVITTFTHAQTFDHCVSSKEKDMSSSGKNNCERNEESVIINVALDKSTPSEQK